MDLTYIKGDDILAARRSACNLDRIVDRLSATATNNPGQNIAVEITVRITARITVKFTVRITVPHQWKGGGQWLIACALG